MRNLNQWRVFDSAETVADEAAMWLCGLACAATGRFAVCLSGGSTPQRLFQRLAGDAYFTRFPWTRVHWFWGDERFVPHSDPRSNFRMAWEALLSRVSLPKDNIHPVETQDLSIEDAALKYERELKSFYGSEHLEDGRPLFDVTFLGIGEDGHTASLFPGSPGLEEKRRWVLAVVDEKRREPRITLTYPVLDSSRNVAFLATGPRKTDILSRVRAGDSNLPAARIRPMGNLWWFVDRAAMPDWPRASN